MDKLQKLFESRLGFEIISLGGRGGCSAIIEWQLRCRDGSLLVGRGSTLEDIVEDLWKVAKEHYPDAECFKEENQGPPPPPVIVSTGTPLSIGRKERG